MSINQLIFNMILDLLKQLIVITNLLFNLICVLDYHHLRELILQYIILKNIVFQELLCHKSKFIFLLTTF